MGFKLSLFTNCFSISQFIVLIFFISSFYRYCRQSSSRTKTSQRNNITLHNRSNGTKWQTDKVSNWPITNFTQELLVQAKSASHCPSSFYMCPGVSRVISTTLSCTTVATAMKLFTASWSTTCSWPISSPLQSTWCCVDWHLFSGRFNPTYIAVELWHLSFPSCSLITNLYSFFPHAVWRHHLRLIMYWLNRLQTVHGSFCAAGILV